MYNRAVTSRKALSSLRMKDDDLFDLLASLSPDEVVRRRRDAVAELREHGWTIQAIADRLGVTKSAVSNWVNRH